MPCVTDDAPWQSYFFGRKGDPAKPFKWTYHVFWGLEDVIVNYVGIWDASGASKVVGGLFPNDSDGNAWGDPKIGFPGPLDQGRLQARRSRPLPAAQQRLFLPDFRFQTGGRRDRHRRDDPAGLRDLLVAGGAAGLQAQGRHHRQGAAVPVRDRRDGRPRRRPDDRKSGGPRPIRSSRASPAIPPGDFDAYKRRPASRGRNARLRARPVRIAIDVVKRAKDSQRPQSVRDAVDTTSRTIIGPISWTGGRNPVKNVCKTPLAGGQWKGARWQV